MISIASPTVRTAALVFVLTLTSPGLPAQQTPETLYQAALYQEEVAGDLDEAIRLYARILDEHGGDAAVAARAGLHLGLCYEKLGMDRAREAYRQVIERYPAQQQEVAVARVRLEALEQAARDVAAAPRFRKVHIPTRPQNGVLSPSGDSLAFVSQGSLWIVPLESAVGPEVTGEPKILAENIGAWDLMSLFSWSADGKWIAVNTEVGTATESSLVRVISLDHETDRTVRVPPRDQTLSNYRIALSPHGETLFFARAGTEAGGGPTLYRASSDTGVSEPLMPRARGASVSPDGALVAVTRPRAVRGDSADIREAEGTIDISATLEDLWVVPAAGGAPVRLAGVDARLNGPVWSPDGRHIAVRHEQANDQLCGEIIVYRLGADGSTARERTRIALPRASADMIAGWTTGGEIGVFMTSELHGAVYTVPAEGGRAVQVSVDLPYGLYPRWSADGARLFFRNPRMEGKEITIVLASVPARGGPMTELPVHAPHDLVSRVPGAGLSVSPDGDWLLMSAFQLTALEKGQDLWKVPLDGGPAIRLTDDRSDEFYPVWTPDGAWVVFLDQVSEDPRAHPALFRIPASGGAAERLTSPGDSVDWGPVAVSPDGTRIAFLSGGSLKTVALSGGDVRVLIQEVRAGRHSDLAWSPDGTHIAWDGGGRIWIAPADGSAPAVALEAGLPEDARLGSFSWSPDGSRIAFVAWLGGEDELWMISDFLPEGGR